MKTYSVTFDMKENCTNCVEVNQVANYSVCADPQNSYFNIKVEANNNEDAIKVAALYVKKFILDSACKQCDKVFELAMENY